MNLYISELEFFNSALDDLPSKKVLINTLNAYCYDIAQEDSFYSQALISSDILLPDGISIVLAKLALNKIRLKKIAGADLFFYEMKRLNDTSGKCFFLGSSPSTLDRIKKRAKNEYPNVRIFSYSPPFVSDFSRCDSQKMILAVNKCKPDVLFIGMTAPKQEKWAYKHFNELDAGHICSIGAVFDFFAGNINRAPVWMINLGFEWFYRLLKEPRRLWRRYLIGNFVFIRFIILEKIRLFAKKNFKITPA